MESASLESAEQIKVRDGHKKRILSDNCCAREEAAAQKDACPRRHVGSGARGPIDGVRVCACAHVGPWGCVQVCRRACVHSVGVLHLRRYKRR